MLGSRTAHSSQGEATQMLTEYHGTVTSFDQLAVWSVFDAPQDGFCPLLCHGTPLAHTGPGVIQQRQIPFCRAVLQPLLSLCILVPALLHTRCSIQHLDVLNFILSITAQCPSLSRPLSKASWPMRESTALPVGNHQKTW